MLSRVNELAEGELVLVRSGDRVPVDGVIREGKSNLNESMITGENTKLSGIMRLVSEAQESKSRSQLLADRAAQMLTGVAISAALITLVVWQLVDAPIDFTVVRGL